MAKVKITLQRTMETLSRHQFDSSSYVVFDAGVYREPGTGKLVRPAVSDDEKRKKVRAA